MPTPARPPLYLVDDDEAVLDSLRFMLESCDERQLLSFSDGERFLAEVDLHQPACLILDCRMPGLSGPEVQQRLKAAQSPIAILFLTGHGEVPLAVESLKLGAVDFLQKPVQLAPCSPPSSGPSRRRRRRPPASPSWPPLSASPRANASCCSSSPGATRTSR
ncbi:hypothetical protein KAM472_01230 [Aeromonas caviae]|nr:hypothetical protein KAM462_00810 [Aeromonas caviae]GKR08576.1 hypothetical protein KAM465_01530 [Aeromonas caviae]GKR12720.1 hypothetical protein KAM466_00380 [Aeromonas caviae]GKR17195.1 hypothetical protein KAM467_02390 [Aeromonas caviae]GKR22321.1 hypothetical protein KAM468_10610 [Aeromonas caviae]